MTLSELMADKEPNKEYKGFALADHMVLAIDTTKEQNAKVSEYTVAQLGLKNTSGSLNPETKTNAYIRAGKSTTKTGNQRTIEFEIDRYLGDDFQDFALSTSMMYATGQDAVVNYVYFNYLTGIGEKGQGTLIIDSDAGGNAEENLTASGSIQKSGDAPVEFDWSTASAE